MQKYPNMECSMKCCEFHEDFSHSTTKYFSLYEEIEYLILSGYLKEFINDMQQA